ncbi:hypothetical protein ACRALDRAFT_207730 [Sodiomyces alcalophilus JCM 7366]|uniref:uncharacterized protein n=1 Tax=Sodiomyces alcalophilus JCM 7366 TaxID=591952 RepID=UPI0039B63B72
MGPWVRCDHHLVADNHDVFLQISHSLAEKLTAWPPPTLNSSSETHIDNRTRLVDMFGVMYKSTTSAGVALDRPDLNATGEYHAYFVAIDGALNAMNGPGWNSIQPWTANKTSCSPIRPPQLSMVSP